MKQIAIIRFWYEGSAFSPAIARRGDFRNREWLWGEAAREFYTGQGLETGACVDFLNAHPDVQGEFVFCAAAYPAGPIEAGLGAEILARIESGLGEREWDGVYLSLHGSSVFEDLEGFEAIVLKRVRARVGDIPLAASFDLHANLDPAIAELADIVTGYKTYPHMDMYATGQRAMSLLYRAVQDEIRPASRILSCGFAPTSFNMRTASGPMADITRAAAREEQVEKLYDITVFGGFIYADSPHTGASVTVCAEQTGMARAEAAAHRIVELCRQRAPEFDVRLPDPESILPDLAAATQQHIAVLEPSDNPFSGGAGDTPGLLRAVLELLPDTPSVFAFFHDPGLVRAAHTAGVGATLACRFGARLAASYGEPVVAHASVVMLTAGKFRNQGPMETNLPVALGASAVLRVAQARIIVTSNNIPVNDPGYFLLHGIDLHDTPLVFVKAKNHFRAAFTNSFDQILEVETAGPAQSDIASLPFKQVPVQRLNFGRQPISRGSGA